MNTKQLTKILNNKLKFPKGRAGEDQRSYAAVLENEANKIIAESLKFKVKEALTVKSLDDITVDENFIDTKTTDESRGFKMPNMISIDRFYKKVIIENKSLYYNFIIYNSEEKKIVDTFLLSVFELNWEHLQMANIGKGQLQIKNMKNFLDSPTTNISKEEWVTRFLQETISFQKNVQQVAKKRELLWIERLNKVDDY
jgi:hypothetical protein